MDNHTENCCHNHEHRHHEGEFCHNNHSESCHCHSHASCGCGHSHIEVSKSDLLTFALTLAVFILVQIINLPSYLAQILTVSATIVCGFKIYMSAIKSILKYKFDENTLILIASIASVYMGEVSEAYIITLLFGIGQFLEDYAINKSNKKISALIDTADETAYNEFGQKINPAKIKSGDIMLVRPGDKLCTDAKIIKGEASFDVSNLTGESMPLDKKAGDDLLAGTVNLTASVLCVATSDYINSTAAKIRSYVLEASRKKATTEKFITKFAKVYTPIIIILSIVLAIVLPIVGIADVSDSVKRALTFMIASCPCALVISIPLSYYAAIGTASKNGILIKGSKHINTLAKANAIAFDKTGTLTEGKIKVSDIVCTDISKEDAIMYASALEIHSNHPIARAICEVSGGSKYTATDVTEHFGKGITGTVNGHRVALCSNTLARELGYIVNDTDSNGITLYIDGKMSAVIMLSDEIRPDAPELIDSLGRLKFKSITVLSGDSNAKVDSLCKKLGKIHGIGELLPHQKADKISEIKHRSKGVIFVGDGVNDAPALTKADVSISVGSGSSLALETGDATLISSSIKAVASTIRICRYAMAVVFSNIIFALGVKFAVLIFAALGMAPIWLALFADVGVLIITIVNSLSILYKK